MCGWRDARKPLCSLVFLLLRPNAFFLLPWRSIKHTDMKTWMMTLGLLTMAATMTAQDARMGSRNDGKGGTHHGDDPKLRAAMLERLDASARRTLLKGNYYVYYCM